MDPLEFRRQERVASVPQTLLRRRRQGHRLGAPATPTPGAAPGPQEARHRHGQRQLVRHGPGGRGGRGAGAPGRQRRAVPRRPGSRDGPPDRAGRDRGRGAGSAAGRHHGACRRHALPPGGNSGGQHHDQLLGPRRRASPRTTPGCGSRPWPPRSSTRSRRSSSLPTGRIVVAASPERNVSLPRGGAEDAGRGHRLPRRAQAAVRDLPPGPGRDAVRRGGGGRGDRRDPRPQDGRP